MSVAAFGHIYPTLGSAVLLCSQRSLISVVEASGFVPRMRRTQLAGGLYDLSSCVLVSQLRGNVCRSSTTMSIVSDWMLDCF